MRRVMTAFVVMIVAMGCSEKRKPTDPDPEAPAYRERTSPENVLFNLALAYGEMEIDGYDDQLDPSFVFVPSPEDPGVDYEQLSYAEDIQSTRNMFESVESVELQLTHPDSEPSDFVEYPAIEGHRKVEVTSVDLRVTTREMVDGSSLILLVPGDPALFIFAPDSSVSPPTYRIVYQADNS